MIKGLVSGVLFIAQQAQGYELKQWCCSASKYLLIFQVKGPGRQHCGLESTQSKCKVLSINFSDSYSLLTSPPSEDVTQKRVKRHLSYQFYWVSGNEIKEQITTKNPLRAKKIA